MPKKRENILGKIVQKDYNNLLEKVIETKDFDEDVKNLLLGIFYKLDVSYKDYQKVKRNVPSKKEYIENLIQIIEKNCKTIKIIKPNSKQLDDIGERTFLVDKNKKKIICYPVERKLLYSISKIGKQDEIIRKQYYLKNKTISDIINIGNNINTVEPLRDFNGWSWLIVRKEIENISYNLIYQNLRILVGDKFLNSWIENKEYLIDYYEELQNELEEKFGTKLKNKLISNLEKLSIYLQLEINPEYEETLKELQQKNEQLLNKFENNQQFVEELTKEKKEINKKLKTIEKALASKESLEQEYTKRNENLPLDKKIFSIKILEKDLKIEKQKLLEQLDNKNELLNPKKFIEEKGKLEKIQELLQIIKVEDKKKEKNRLLEEFQKIFLQCFLVLINVAETKEEIIDLLYILRYYNLLPISDKHDINQNIALQKNLKEIKTELLRKAVDYKIIATLSQDLEENSMLLQFIFETKIISIEDIYVSLIKEKDKYYIEFSEANENSYEEKIEIKKLNKETLNVKLNKIVKVLN